MDRTFLLPLVSLTALTATGCAEPVIGSWTGASITFSDGRIVRELPDVYTQTYDGVTYTKTYGLYLDFEEAGRARFSLVYTVEVNGELADDLSETEDISWSRDGDVVTMTFADGEGMLDMACTLDGDVLECPDDEGDDRTIFVRDED